VCVQPLQIIQRKGTANQDSPNVQTHHNNKRFFEQRIAVTGGPAEPLRGLGPNLSPYKVLLYYCTEGNFVDSGQNSQPPDVLSEHPKEQSAAGQPTYSNE
jgi:hypothetical protein